MSSTTQFENVIVNFLALSGMIEQKDFFVLLFKLFVIAIVGKIVENFYKNQRVLSQSSQRNKVVYLNSV